MTPDLDTPQSTLCQLCSFVHTAGQVSARGVVPVNSSGDQAHAEATRQWLVSYTVGMTEVRLTAAAVS